MSSESLKTFWGKPRLRFLVAGLIPFLCIFNATILQYKIIFALGGMVNHTMIENAGNTVNTTFNVDFPGTCISKDRASRGNLFDDGPFDWSPTIESVVVSAGLFGCMSGMAVALFIYEILDSRLIISSTFFIAGLLTIVTPPLATFGGSHSYVIVAATEFLVCALTSILTPEIPTLINNWFRLSEYYLITNLVLMGLDTGRITFSFTGVIVKKFGWEYLFYIPGIMSIAIGFVYYIFVTREPYDNVFLSQQEKELIGLDHNRILSNDQKEPKSKSRAHKFALTALRFKRDMKVMNTQTTSHVRPWGKIFTTPMFWLSVMQQTSQTWIMSIMVYLNKDFLEEIHGYSVEEAALMVTIPNNLFNIVVYIITGHLADFLASMKTPKITIRRLGVIIQILSVVPIFVMPFLPCKLLEVREVTVLIAILSSFRIVGTLAGYASFNDLSPTFQGTLVSMSYFSQNTGPGLLISFLKGYFGFTPLSAWQKNYSINCSLVIMFSLLYLVFLKTDPAPWDPSQQPDKDDTKKPTE